MYSYIFSNGYGDDVTFVTREFDTDTGTCGWMSL